MNVITLPKFDKERRVYIDFHDARLVKWDTLANESRFSTELTLTSISVFQEDEVGRTWSWFSTGKFAAITVEEDELFLSNDLPIWLDDVQIQKGESNLEPIASLHGLSRGRLWLIGIDGTRYWVETESVEWSIDVGTEFEPWDGS